MFKKSSGFSLFYPEYLSSFTQKSSFIGEISTFFIKIDFNYILILRMRTKPLSIFKFLLGLLKILNLLAFKRKITDMGLINHHPSCQRAHNSMLWIHNEKLSSPSYVLGPEMAGRASLPLRFLRAFHLCLSPSRRKLPPCSLILNQFTSSQPLLLPSLKK